MRHRVIPLVLILLTAVASGCSVLHPGHAPAARIVSPPPPSRIGFSAPDPASVQKVATLTGIRPAFLGTYAAVGSPFLSGWADAAARVHATLLIQLDSDSISLASIASGAYDQWLRSWAQAVRTAPCPVAIGFDHEFNGPWWPWSYEHITPAVFIAAWQHIVTVFRQQRADVAWVWTLSNVTGPQAAGARAYWPGASYVTWVGVNGYYYRKSDTFSSVFSPVLAQVHAITSDPVLITETGANPASGRERAIADLMHGAAMTPGVMGLVWFDYDKYPGHNWLIDSDPAALAAFKAGARQYEQGR